MVSGISGVNNTYTYNGNTYRQRSKEEAELGFVLATLASAVIYKALPSFSNPFLKQMAREHSNNHLYKDAFISAIEKSGLREKGLSFIPTSFSSAAEEIMYKNGKKVTNGDIKAGLNACYIPDIRAVRLNPEKATISGFHELGHAMNHLSGKFGKVLQKLRGPGYWLAGLMGTVAVLSRNKPKDDKNKTVMDWVQDHAAGIAVVGMLPTVAEEAMASYKGVNLARKAGLAEPLIKNLKKFYKKAWMSYVGYAALTGLSVYAMSKITDIFTRPKKTD